MLPIRRYMRYAAQRLYRQRDELRAERDAARNERDMALRTLRDTVSIIEAGSLPTQRNGQADALPTWNLPGGMILTAAPQRYTDNYLKYISAGGEYLAYDIEAYEPGATHRALDKTRFYAFCLALDLVKKDSVPGDIAELGVGKGHSASVLALWAGRLNKQLYLLDTFEGFHRADLVGTDSDHEVQYADVSLDMLGKRIPGRHVHFIKGRFPETAVQVADEIRFCLVHLDCDLYKPFASALEFFWPKLAGGGFLIMHDYSSLYWDGVEKAVDDFFKDKNESPILIPDMAGTAIVRKNKLAA